MTSPLAEVLAAIAAACLALGVRWYLFGAQAALLHGAARLTADADVTVDLGEQPPGRLIGALEDAGFGIRVPDEEFIERTRVLPVLHVATGMPADIVLAGSGLESLFLDRAVTMLVGGVSVPVACAEDLCAMKLLAGRPKDLDDVVAILAAQGPKLDDSTLRETLSMLEAALDRSDLLGELDRLRERSRLRLS